MIVLHEPSALLSEDSGSGPFTIHDVKSVHEVTLAFHFRRPNENYCYFCFHPKDLPSPRTYS